MPGTPSPGKDIDLARFYGVNIARDCIQESSGVRTRRRGEYIAAARSRMASDVALQRIVTELESRADYAGPDLTR